jgi:hypothetical protein
MKLLRLGLAVSLGAMLSTCGASQAGSHTSLSGNARAVRPVACPQPMPRRSSPSVPEGLTRAQTQSTTFCIYKSRTRVSAVKGYAGGPLDRSLQTSVRTPPPCASVARLATVLVLTSSTKHVHAVLNMSGCPRLVVASGKARYLTGRGGGKVTKFYDETAGSQ